MKKIIISFALALLLLPSLARAVAAPTGLAAGTYINSQLPLSWNEDTIVQSWYIYVNGTLFVTPSKSSTSLNGSTRSYILQPMAPAASWTITMRAQASGQPLSALSAPLVASGTTVPVVYVASPPGEPLVVTGGGGGGGATAVTVIASVLPTGASTSALQTTGNSSLSSIDGKITAVNTGAVTISTALPVGANTIGGVTQSGTWNVTTSESLAYKGVSIVANATDFATETTLSALNTKVTAVDTGAVVVSSSVLPTGAATQVLQTAGNASLVTIAGDTTSMDAKIPVLGQTTMAGSQPVAIASNQSAIPVIVISSSLPANAATSSNQILGNSTLNAIEINTGLLADDTTYKGVSIVANATDFATQTTLATRASETTLATRASEATLSSLNGKVTAVNTGAVTISTALPAGTNNIGDVDIVSSVLPTNASTSALQTTGNNSLGTIAGDTTSIDNKIPSATNTVHQTTVITAATTETTILTAGGGVFHDIDLIFVSNPDSNTSLTIEFRDATGGSVVWRGHATSSGGGFVIPFPVALPQTTAANNWTAEITAGASPGVMINVVGHVRQ